MINMQPNGLRHLQFIENTSTILSPADTHLKAMWRVYDRSALHLHNDPLSVHSVWQRIDEDVRTFMIFYNDFKRNKTKCNETKCEIIGKVAQDWQIMLHDPDILAPKTRMLREAPRGVSKSLTSCSILELWAQTSRLGPSRHGLDDDGSNESLVERPCYYPVSVTGVTDGRFVLVGD